MKSRIDSKIELPIFFGATMLWTWVIGFITVILGASTLDNGSMQQCRYHLGFFDFRHKQHNWKLDSICWAHLVRENLFHGSYHTCDIESNSWVDLYYFEHR